jgi:hypothetical protein
MEDDKDGDKEFPLFRSPLQAPGELALSASEKAEDLAASLEAQIHSVNEPSDQTVNGMINGAMRAYEYDLAREPTVMNPSDGLQAIKGLKVCKDPRPEGIQNRVLRHLPDGAITFVTKVFNAVACSQYFPPVWKQARVVSILKPRKDTTLHSSS